MHTQSNEQMKNQTERERAAILVEFSQIVRSLSDEEAEELMVCAASLEVRLVP